MPAIILSQYSTVVAAGLTSSTSKSSVRVTIILVNAVQRIVVDISVEVCGNNKYGNKRSSSQWSTAVVAVY